MIFSSLVLRIFISPQDSKIVAEALTPIQKFVNLARSLKGNAITTNFESLENSVHNPDSTIVKGDQVVVSVDKLPHLALYIKAPDHLESWDFPPNMHWYKKCLVDLECHINRGTLTLVEYGPNIIGKSWNLYFWMKVQQIYGASGAPSWQLDNGPFISLVPLIAELRKRFSMVDDDLVDSGKENHVDKIDAILLKNMSKAEISMLLLTYGVEYKSWFVRNG